MSRPRRPPRRRPRLPARVFWFRRGLLLAVLALLVGLGASLVSGPDQPAGSTASEAGTDPAAGTAPTPPTSTPAPDPRRRDRPDRERNKQGAGREGSGRDGPIGVTTALAPVDGDCNPTLVEVRPSVAGAPVEGETVQLELVLHTTASTGCRLELSAEQLLVQVRTVDGTRVWDTEQCPEAVPGGTVALRPDWQLSTTLSWSGRRGDRGCTGRTKLAGAGPYAVQAAVFGGEPGEAAFEMSPKPEKPDRGDRRGQGQHPESGAGQT